MIERWKLRVLVAFQAGCALTLAGGAALRLFGGGPPAGGRTFAAVVEMAAAFGLLLSVAGVAALLERGRHRLSRAEAARQRASVDVREVLDARFAAWKLTPAEIDVALLALRGLSTAQIAELRHTSEGTVKAQTNTICRKAGVSGRIQLLSLFLADLMPEPVAGSEPESGGG